MQINETKEFHKNLQPARNHIDHQETPGNDMQERPLVGVSNHCGWAWGKTKWPWTKPT